MGDSVLHGVNSKGLQHNVHKHSVSGATIRTMLRDIELYDLKQFSSIIFYIGGNDLSRNIDSDLIEEQYDQLIAIVKSQNPECQIILCKLAPRGDVDVSVINKIVERLACHHKTECADNFRAFFDKNGSIITRFLNPNDHIHPSKSGVKRILATINEPVKLVYDFEKCVFTRQAYNHPDNRDYTRQDRNRSANQLFGENNGRCLNCYDSSHSTYRCRHKRPVVCWFCGLTGHKQQFCWNTY